MCRPKKKMSSPRGPGDTTWTHRDKSLHAYLTFLFFGAPGCKIITKLSHIFLRSKFCHGQSTLTSNKCEDHTAALHFLFYSRIPYIIILLTPPGHGSCTLIFKSRIGYIFFTTDDRQSRPPYIFFRSTCIVHGDLTFFVLRD